MHDYALCHVYWTIPPAAALWFFGRKWRTSRDVFKTCLLIAIAVVSTTPWDSFLIRNKIWSYPPESILGYTFLDIPLEEMFFFVIQTYITANLYHILSKPVIHPFKLTAAPSAGKRLFHLLGMMVLAYACQRSIVNLALEGKQFYMSLIVAWAGPFLLLLWSVAGMHILHLPLHAAVLPIALPTAYLWLVDTVALRRGTWVIEAATKLEIHLWEGLDIEEAAFFLLTNTLIIFGLIACDYSFALHDTFPGLYTPRSTPTPLSIISALVQGYMREQTQKLQQLHQVQHILDEKSKSFSFAAAAFEGRLQLGLPCLYAACRVADDSIDFAPNAKEVSARIDAMSHILSPDTSKTSSKAATTSTLSLEARQALRLYNDLDLPPHLFHELISGFETDARFSQNELPINDATALEQYCSNVASSVGEMCVRLVWQAHGTAGLSEQEQAHVIASARAMGRALQLVNIARDVPADLRNGRIYLPGRPLMDCTQANLESLSAERLRLVDEADAIAVQYEHAIDQLPEQVQKGMKAACRLYLEIGSQVRLSIARGDVLGRAQTTKWEKLKVILGLTFID